MKIFGKSTHLNSHKYKYSFHQNKLLLLVYLHPTHFFPKTNNYPQNLLKRKLDISAIKIILLANTTLKSNSFGEDKLEKNKSQYGDNLDRKIIGIHKT